MLQFNLELKTKQKPDKAQHKKNEENRYMPSMAVNKILIMASRKTVYGSLNSVCFFFIFTFFLIKALEKTKRLLWKMLRYFICEL